MLADQPLPDLFATRRALRPVLPLIHRGLEWGAQQALLYFEHADHPYEGGLHAAIMRAWARHFLQLRGFTLEDLPSNGICLHLDDYRIKILKAPEDSLPDTNHSRARLQFLQQELPLAGDEFRPRRWNLLILWNVDTKLHLVDLRVACTKPIDGNPDGYAIYWQFPIEHPAKTLVASPAIVEDDDEDLGYSLPNARVADAETTE
jgi:hypothetical protein